MTMIRVTLESLLITISLVLAAAVLTIVAKNFGRTISRLFFDIKDDNVDSISNGMRSSNYFPNND